MQWVINVCCGGDGNISSYFLSSMQAQVQVAIAPFSPKEEEHLFCSPRLKAYTAQHIALPHSPLLPSLK